MSAFARVFGLALAAQAAKVALLVAAGRGLPDYDTSASSSGWATCPGSDPTAPGWGLVVWDSVHFARIACRGYEYEQQYAFFPLLPAALRALRRLAGPRHVVSAGLLLCGVSSALAAALLHSLTLAVTRRRRLAALSALAWTFSAAGPFTTGLYTEGPFAALTLLGLCTLYCAFPRWPPPEQPGAGAGDAWCSPLLASEPEEEEGTALLLARLLAAGACFALASCARSNGVVNAGFVAHAAAQAAIRRVHASSASLRAVAQASLLLAAGAAAAGATTAPLLLHQLHAHAALCAHQPPAASVNPALAPGVAGAALRAVLGTLWAPALQAQAAGSGAPTLPGAAAPEWCARRPAWWPSAYAHVQARYWDVGLLRYWRLSQVPNFLLAAPVLALALACVAAYARRRPRLLLAGGFAWGGRAAAGPSVLTAARGAEAEHTVAGAPGAATPLGRTVVTRRMAAAQRVSTAAGAGDAELVRGVPVRQPGLRDVAESGGGARREEDAEGDAGFLAPGLAVFIYPLAFSAGCALLVMHVQVATRFLLSSSPALFWYVGHLLEPLCGAGGGKARGGSSSPAPRAAARWIWAWSWGYALVGTVLFANFYPWT